MDQLARFPLKITVLLWALLFTHMTAWVNPSIFAYLWPFNQVSNCCNSSSSNIYDNYFLIFQIEVLTMILQTTLSTKIAHRYGAVRNINLFLYQALNKVVGLFSSWWWASSALGDRGMSLLMFRGTLTEFWASWQKCIKPAFYKVFFFFFFSFCFIVESWWAIGGFFS